MSWMSKVMRCSFSERHAPLRVRIYGVELHVVNELKYLGSILLVIGGWK